jgi:hypothetical protein
MTDTINHGPVAREARVVPAILGIQALALGIVAVAVFAGAGVGSTALRVGVGALFLVLAGSAAGIALTYAEGQPSARSAALVFEGFALALALLWLAPLPALVGAALAIVAIVVASRQMRRPVPAQ